MTVVAVAVLGLSGFPRERRRSPSSAAAPRCRRAAVL